MELARDEWTDKGLRYFSGEAADTERWAGAIVESFGALAGTVERSFVARRRQDRKEANVWLRDAEQALKRGHPLWRSLRGPSDFEDKARWCASQCQTLETLTQLRQFCLNNGLPMPSYETEEGALRRAADFQVWRRIIRKIVSQWWDQLMRLIGYVHKHKQIYCSDQVVRWQTQRKKANRELLEQIIARSNEGDEMTLAEIQDASTANPENRFAELMVRCRGLEEYAADKGYMAHAVTLTCPSKYHCRYAVSGDPNTKWNRCTPKEANDYLCGVWRKIRAKLKREDWLGYRVVEAHHDGTPHWHLMLFLRSDRVDFIESVFLHYGLQEDGSEYGAKKHRVKFESIDERRGSATGYMTKYIAKNIEGAATNDDFFGNKAEVAEQRVVAWARTWRIRQFQFFGDASVTVWREYRRIREEKATSVVPPHHVPWYDASVLSSWAGFRERMGAGRAQLSTLARDNRIHPETGECTPAVNRYGEPLSALPIVGILRDGEFLDTRTKFWEMGRAASVAGLNAFLSEREYRALGLVSLTVREEVDFDRYSKPPP